MKNNKPLIIIFILMAVTVLFAGVLLVLPAPSLPAETPAFETATEPTVSISLPPATETVPVTEPTETAEPTEVETELPPDSGLYGVQMVLEEDPVATPDHPEVTVRVTFTGVDPTGEPEGGRICKVIVYENGEATDTDDNFALTEGAVFEFSRSFEFERYMYGQNELRLTVWLEYNGEHIYKSVSIAIQNYSDERYMLQQHWDPYPYSITIVGNLNTAIIYGKDEEGEYTQVVKVFVCSTGTGTPRNQKCQLLRKYEWKELLHSVWGQYATWVTGNVLIHSVPYNSPDKDNLWSSQYNRLGRSVSMGCIRMRVCDCKWIYNYCPCGTPVQFVTLRELPEGVTAPTYEPLDLDDERAGWDPTDPDPENPWKPELPDMSWTADIPGYDELLEANCLYIKDYKKYVQQREQELAAMAETETATEFPEETAEP